MGMVALRQVLEGIVEVSVGQRLERAQVVSRNNLSLEGRVGRLVGPYHMFGMATPRFQGSISYIFLTACGGKW